eukprot:6704034-Pyramimonas_sp.AAC.1
MLQCWNGLTRALRAPDRRQVTVRLVGVRNIPHMRRCDWPGCGIFRRQVLRCDVCAEALLRSARCWAAGACGHSLTNGTSP